MKNRTSLLAASVAALLAAGTMTANAAPTITRLTPPSQFFATSGSQHAPMIARFVQGQLFDLQATVRPDSGQTITKVQWSMDGKPLRYTANKASLVPATVITATVPGAVAASDW